MEPPPSPRRDPVPGMLPPRTSSPRRTPVSTSTPRPSSPTKIPTLQPRHSPAPAIKPDSSTTTQTQTQTQAATAPPHQPQPQPQHQRRFRPKYYEGSPMLNPTPPSSIDGDLDAISELEVPVTYPYITPTHNHNQNHNHRPHTPTHRAHSLGNPPPSSQPRNLVICLDGTHNSFCDHNSNVVRLFELLEKSDRQLCYYDSGVGTQQGPWLYGLKKDFAMVTDLAFAWNFKTHVIDAYRFVMDQYQDGDKIWIFGFSRGSYAARALSGMLQYVGLLPKGNHSQVPLAWSIYAASADIPFTDTPFNPSPKDTKVKQPGRSSQYAGTPEEYKRIFSRSVHIPIEFVGVWDTVSALGITKLPNLPFASAIGYVRYFRQALSLDERRAKFVPEYYHEECEPSTEGKEGAKPTTTEKQVLCQRDNGYLRVKEVWFLGCHSDVGGGNTINGQPALSSISLRWMIFEASNLGLKIDNNALFSSRLYNNPKYPTVRRLIPPRYISVENFNAKPIEDEDFLRYRSQSDDTRAATLIREAAEWDALPSTPADKNLPVDLRQDKQESLRGFYWLLEWAWLERWDYVGGNRRKLVKSQNWGKGREIIEQQRVHRSVLNRLSYELQQKEAKTTLIQEVKTEIKRTFLSKKQRKKMDQEREIQWPKATFADGTSWEDLLAKDPEDDVWEMVRSIDEA